MRKGVTTLMTVAIALVSVQALAYAPVIAPIPSPIVGNRVALPSQATRYEFEDALDLNTLATDDNVASDQLVWSYEIVNTPKYAINGDQVLNSAVDNAVAPPSAKQLRTAFNSLAGANSTDRDGLRNTITIRNIALNPYGGPVSTDNSAAAQNWANNAQAVTFWCSDGNLATSQTVMFYTDNTYNGTTPAGYNRLSQSATVWTKMNEWTGAASWAMYDQFLGTTSNTWGGKGVCFTVGLTGQNWGSVASPMGFVTLTDNAVYKIRATMNCSQLSGGKTPFWDFILENFSGYEPAKGLNLYGVDNYYLDNVGSANAIINKTAGTEVTMIWAPAAFQTAQWRSTATGIFAQNPPPPPPTNSGIDYHLQKDAQLRYRVLDVDNNAALFNNQKSGSICLLSCVVETTPVSRKVYTSGSSATPATADIYSVTSGLKAVHNNTNDPVPGNMLVSSITGATISFSGGVLQITPSGTSRQNDIVQITPATDIFYDPRDATTMDDDWPIAWQSNKIYELAVNMSAPDSTAAAHPWDIVWLNIEPFTNEVITESYVTANKNIAMPKNGTPQTYYMYYYSCNETASGTPSQHFLRWRVRFGNSSGLNWPSVTDTMNTGMVRIHSVKVNTVDFR